MPAAPFLQQVADIAAVVIGCVAGLQVGALVLLILHELAHALVGWAVGFRILVVHLGGGPAIGTRWWRGVRIELHRAPWRGHVEWQVRGARWLRTRFLLATLAGPFANLAIALATLPFVAAAMERFPHELDGLDAFVLAFSVIALSAATVAFWPSGVPDSLRVTMDLPTAFRAARWRPADVSSLLGQWDRLAVLHGVWDAFHRGEPALVRERLVAAEAEHPAEPVWAEVRSLLALVEGDHAAAVVWHDRSEQLAQAMLVEHDKLAINCDRKDFAREMREGCETGLAVNRAFFLAQTGRPEDLATADGLCEALAAKSMVDEGHIATLRTHGFVRLRQGRIDEGMQMLEQAFRLPEPFWLRALTAGYLAYGHALRGDGRLARRWVRRGRRIHPQSLMVDIGERLVAEVV